MKINILRVWYISCIWWCVCMTQHDKAVASNALLRPTKSLASMLWNASPNFASLVQRNSKARQTFRTLPSWPTASLEQPQQLLHGMVFPNDATKASQSLLPREIQHASNIVPFLKRSSSTYNSNAFVECKQVPAHAEDRRPNKQALTLVTYNVNFLFFKNTFNQVQGSSDEHDARIRGNPKRIKHIAKELYALNADMIQLTEVEDCDTLRRLMHELVALGDAGTYKPYLVRGTDHFTGQNVGLLTRIDPYEFGRTEMMETIQPQFKAQQASPPSSHSSTSTSIQGRSRVGKVKQLTKHFIAKFNVPGLNQALTLVGVHLLAGSFGPEKIRSREAQARIVRRLIQQATALGEHAIVAGDFNDYSRLVLDRSENLPESNVLNMLEAMPMLNILNQVQQEQRFTLGYTSCPIPPVKLLGKRKSREVSSFHGVDHILLSPSLQCNVQDVSIANHGYNFANLGQSPSDHFPVKISLLTSPKSPPSHE